MTLFRLAAVPLLALTFSTGAMAADEAQKEVTGTVQQADQATQEFQIEGQKFIVKGGGTAVFPNNGDEVTLKYEEQGGQNVVTQIGQKQ